MERSGKKRYSSPKCVSKSFSEAASLPREKDISRLVIIQGFLGEAISILEAADRCKIHGHVCVVGIDSRLERMACKRWQCDRSDFLLLGLSRPGAGMFQILGGVQNEETPIAILTESTLDTEFSGLCDQFGAWRLGQPKDLSDVVMGLKALLNLWSEAASRGSHTQASGFWAASPNMEVPVRTQMEGRRDP